MTLILLPVLAGLASALRLEEPIVIQRPLEKVEWGDVLLEYDATQPPPGNVTVTIDLRVFHHSRPSSETLKIYMELSEEWQDGRLIFQHNPATVTLPRGVEIWRPETWIRDGIEDRTERETLRIHPRDGTVTHRSIRTVEIPCRGGEKESCPLVFSSFTDVSSRVDYAMRRVDAPHLNSTVTPSGVVFSLGLL